MHKGSCLCGAVSFTIGVPMRPVVACHCRQCRKQSGHFWAATSVPDAELRLERDEGLEWYHASPGVRRGFCRECGATLFWKPQDEARIAVAAASLDEPTGLRLEKHVFVADKGDYYDIADGLPQFSRFSGERYA